MKKQMYMFNEAEGVFFPAFDRYLCEDRALSVNQGKIVRIWDGLAVSGGACFTLHWSGQVILGGYDHLLTFMSVPANALVDGRVVVDGREILLYKNRMGSTDPSEWSSSFDCDANGVLTDLYLDFKFPTDHNTVSISWFGLRNSSLEDKITERIPVWQESWCEGIHGGKVGEIENNLLMSEQEAKHMRELFKQNVTLKEAVLKNAETAMKVNVEDQMGEYIPKADYRFVRLRDRGRIPMEGMILNLAVAGYLLQEPAYSYQAAKMILAAIRMKWYEGSVCDMEGSKFHHVCFTEDHTVTEICLAMGFLGGI